MDETLVPKPFVKRVSANDQARLSTQREVKRGPSRKVKDWLRRYRLRLLARGLSLDEVLGIEPEVDLTYDPADCADDEIDAMAETRNYVCEL